MAGLDLIARKSLERGSLSSVLINDQVQGVVDAEQKHWSWHGLQEQFRLKKSEKLFRKYQARLQHSLFIVALMLNALYGIVCISVLFSMTKKEEDVAVPLVTKGAGFVVTLAVFVVAYRESWFRTDLARVAAALVVLLAMVCSVYGGTLYYVARQSDQIKDVRMPSNILISLFLFLPFPRMYQAVLAGLAITVLELTLLALDRTTHELPSEDALMPRQMAADTVFHVTVGLACLYTRFLMEFINRRAFLDKRECFESKFHLEYEKEQEEQLLLSILPKHISGKVRDDIREAIRRIDQELIPQRPFTDLYVERHQDVSILYADIVNSMLLTASLNVSELVETLNELFGRFDECAERNRCMRIKLLGDCYYCVSGMPARDPQHADHCVQMGLDMIELIRSFREESHVNVDMRIGVHSGSVLSGLLGLRKWQFDIWSRDVAIASRLEQTGKPGCVHISRTTKDHLHRKYNIKPAYRDLPDSNRNNAETETFLITPHIKQQVQKSPIIQTRSLHAPTRRHSTSSVASVHRNPSNMMRRPSAITEVLSSRRRTVLGSSLLQYRKMVSQVNHFMENVIDTMALSKTDKWFRSEGIQPLFLTFRHMFLERPYLEQTDLLFKYYPLSALLLFVGMATIRILTMPPVGFVWLLYLVISFVIVACCVCSWMGYLWTKFVTPIDGNNFFHTSAASRISRLLTHNVIVRMCLSFVISVLLLSSSLIGLSNCQNSVTSPQGNVTTNITEADQPLACLNPWYFTFSAVLALMTASMFLRIHYFLKLLVNTVALLIFITVLTRDSADIFQKSRVRLADWKWLNVHPVVEHCWCLVLTWFTLHVLDRQVEYICRLDYLWKRRLWGEQEETRTMGLVNRTLLQNILPIHVAQYYLVQESMHLELDLYHEEYSSVAVMFASIPNFMDFYSDTVMNDEGLRCLQLLHEIICDFDKLLYDPSFQKIEKIKTIGSTYMAAAGLQPGRNSSRSSYESMKVEEDPVHNALILMEFAIAMMNTLQDMNSSTWQNFNLRVGISVGPVIAGVVGVTKPQYDIWGDTVNLASRMDTTGVVGCIQVTEPVAAILTENSRYCCECRGEIFVKGKGWMTTYLVNPLEITRL